MKQAEVYFQDKLAGVLTEDENGYTFAYSETYIAENGTPISLTMPVQSKPYKSNVLFPFFDGLIPEGWLLDIAQANWKINPRDRMSLLLACCKYCIGAVSIVDITNSENQ
jgi:serine/threonine-protein kinase HipA